MVILILLFSFIWSFIFLPFISFVNSNPTRFCSIRSRLSIIEVVGASPLFPLLHAFVSFSLFLVYFDRKVLNNVYQVVNGYLLVPKFIL